MTFTTIADKGSIRDVGRALEIPLSEINNIINNLSFDSKSRLWKDGKLIDSSNESIINENKKLFTFAKLLSGTVISIGSHPAGTVVSPYSLVDMTSTHTVRDSNRPHVQLDMDEVEDLGLVKLDILSLYNHGVLTRASELAGIDMPIPDTLDTRDRKVWENIRKDTTGIFQWEEDWAESYLQTLISDETIEKTKEHNADMDFMDMFIIGNASIRPVGQSYRNEVAQANVESHNSKIIDDFLKDRFGRLIFQEDILEFLNKFCGFSLGEADIIRRAFTSGKNTEEFMPKITDGFVKTMDDQFGMEENEAKEIIESFTQTIIDSSGYLFNVSHATTYSFIGFASGYMRTYYPLEFLTASFEIFEDNMTKTASLYNYMFKHTDVKMKSIKFRHSRARYTMDKETNSIYKGMSSIKYLNKKVSEELYKLRDNEYSTFVDLLVDIVENTSCDSRQRRILIELDFFEEFGNINKLLKINEEFNSGENKYSKNYVDKTKINRIKALKEFESSVDYEEATIIDLIKNQIEYIGYADIIDPSIPKDVAIVTDLNKNQYGTWFATLYRPNNAEIVNVKIYKNVFNELPLEKYMAIQTLRIFDKLKWKSETEKETILDIYRKVNI